METNDVTPIIILLESILTFDEGDVPELVIV
ncbi:MAG: hypothetical protein ACJA0Z_004393 [Halioglobus sp.]